MVVTNVISLQQAARAVDLKIITTIAAALALGVAMEMTGAATYLATFILGLTGTTNPTLILSAFFLLVALMSNIISTKTCAVSAGAPPRRFRTPCGLPEPPNRLISGKRSVEFAAD